MDNLALAGLQRITGSQIPRSWKPVVQFYRHYGNADKLRELAEKVWQNMGNALKEEGISCLIMEPVRLDMVLSHAFSEEFIQDPVANGWEWVNPSGDCSYELKRARLFCMGNPSSYLFH